MRARAVAASLAVLALAHLAAAQLTEKAAIAELKAATKDALKSFKAAGSEATKALNTDLGEFEGLLSDSTTPSDAVGNMDNRVLPFVEAMNTTYEQAVSAANSAASQLLNTLGGDPPADFVYGSGGVLDDFRASLGKAAVKLHDSALKRLAKTQAKAEKVSNLALEVELRMPAQEVSEAVEANAVTAVGQGARLDFVVAASVLGTANDVTIAISGSTSDTSNTVDVGLHDKSGIVSTGGFLPDSDGRFTGTLSSQQEHGFVAFVKQGGPVESTIDIGAH